VTPRDRSITRKALLLGVTPALCVLVLASAAFSIAGLVFTRRSLASDMDALVAVVRDNVAASLAFSDPTTAADVIAPLRAKRNIDTVCVYDEAGELFASYTREGLACASAVPGPGSATSNPRVRVEPVMVGTRHYGLVYLTANYSEVAARMRLQALVAAGALALGALLAVVLARRMQRTISQPILDLARVAKRITDTGDYAVRAEKTTDDEVGALADTFNSMLDHVQQQSRVKDEFLAALSHELRTPLNAIMGWLHILRTTSHDRAILDRALASLERNTRAQTRLVEDLLDVSRIVTGQLQIARAAVDLREVVLLALDDMAPGFTRNQVGITSHVPEAPCIVAADRDRLRQVIGNVLANGLKFTQTHGEVSLSLTESGAAYVITVADNGVGIAPEFLPFVFDRFRQSDGSLTRERGGLGLGLAIAREILERHDGSIAAASAGRGQGSVFTIRIPRAEDAGPVTARRRTIDTAAAGAPLEGVGVLVVDDDPDALETTGHLLRSAGASVRTAASGHEALRVWHDGYSAVVLCDISMPQMDGFELLRQLRNDGARAVPIVALALTAHADTGMQTRCTAAGFDGHVTKPFEAAALLALIEDLLTAKRQTPTA
jgi:signal transduction histidine kinase/CheY-like chemotaxis protein